MKINVVPHFTQSIATDRTLTIIVIIYVAS